MKIDPQPICFVYPFDVKKMSRPIMTMNADDRDRLIDSAVEAINRGELVVLPTETLYGLFVATRPQAIEQLRALTAEEDQPASGLTLHLPDLDLIRDELDLPTPVARRLVSMLLPGPVRVLLEQPRANLDAIARKLDLPDGFFGEDNVIALRVPDHPITRMVLRKAGVSTVARRLGAASWAVGSDPGTTIECIGEHPDPAPACVIDDGTTHFQVGSTTVTIGLDGKFAVAEYGPISQEDVMRMLERRILFVCTGNTCRSPMAEAIARSLVEQEEPTGITTVVESAGIATDDGHEASVDAVEVMRERGLDLTGHRSRMLTPEMIDRAEVVYTMTHMHAQRAMSIAPNAVHKVFPLSERNVVDDPIGHSIEVYRKTADQLTEMITQRFKEIAP